MKAVIRISNYRCFPDHQPATIELTDGDTAFVGTNNSGKSTLMRFFYEFRDLFLIGGSRQILKAVLEGKSQNFPRIDFSEHIENLFHNRNHKPITITLKVDWEAYASQAGTARPVLSKVEIPKALEIEIERSSSESTQWKARLLNDNDEPIIGKTADVHETLERIHIEGYTRPYFFDHFRDALAKLVASQHVGPFRNVLSFGGSRTYFDQALGSEIILRLEQVKARP